MPLLDAASSDASSYELEQPSLVRHTATDHNVFHNDDGLVEQEAERFVSIDNVTQTAHVGRTKPTEGPNDDTVTDASKLPKQSGDLITLTNDEASATGNELATVHRRNSRSSLLAANV